MLNDNELELWKLRLGLDKHASDLIDNIRNSEPARVVRGGGGNVTGRYPSLKMGRTIQFESHTCELAFILLCEFSEDDDVLEYWDQPCKLPITYKNKNGRTIRTISYPDFLVIHKDSVEFVECKTEETLVKLAAEQSNKFCINTDGHWCSPPMEEASAKYGIRYRVFSSAEIDRTLIRNTVFMEDFLRYDLPELPSEITTLITEIVSYNEGIRLSALLAGAEEAQIKADAVYQLIANGILYVDLSQEALVNYDRVFVYSSIPAAKAKDNRISFPKCKFVELKPDEIIQWGDNLFRISNLDQNYVWLIGEKDNHPTIPREHFEQLIQKGEIQCTSTAEEPSSALYWEKLLNDAKPNELKEAQRRYDILMRYYRREPLGEIVPLRTLERLVIQLQESGTLLR